MRLATRSKGSVVVLVAGLVVAMLIALGWRLDNPPIHPRLEQLLNTVEVKLSSGNYYSAYKSMRKAEALDPKNVSTVNLRDIFEILGYPRRENLTTDEALDRYQRLSPRLPESPYLDLIGAELYLKSGDAVTALSVSTEVSSKHPAIPQSWYIIGSAELELGNVRQSLFPFQQAVSRSKRSVYKHSLANVCFFLGDYDCAAEHYKASITRSRTILSARFGYLRSLLQLRQFEEVTKFGNKLREHISRKPERATSKRLAPEFILGNGSLRSETGLSAEELVNLVDTLLILAQDATDPDTKNLCRQDVSSNVLIAEIYMYDCTNLINRNIGNVVKQIQMFSSHTCLNQFILHS